MMSNRSLLEIGTEEIPAKLVKEIYSNVKEKMKELLEENRIEYENIKVYGAPRRIAVEINGLSEFQKQEVNEIKGPPKNIPSMKKVTQLKLPQVLHRVKILQ